MNEGDEACTTNLCQKCFSKHLEAGGGKEGVSEKYVENDGERTIFCVGCGTHFSCERSNAKKFRQLANEEKQAGIQGQWQQESPAKEYLEQVKCCHDTDGNESMMKKGFTAINNETWEEYKETFREKDESLRMALRQDKRGVRVGSTG